MFERVIDPFDPEQDSKPVFHGVLEGKSTSR